MISYGRQSISDDDIQAVIDTLKSDFLTQGPAVQAFEKTIAMYCGVKYCVAVANGTAALHLAVAALELPQGSEGITSTNTFVASSNSMLYCGLKPVFADIDPETFNVTPGTLADKLSPETKLLIPVHFAGQPCRMAEIGSLAKSHSLRVIEDAAHAIGSGYSDGDRVGSCKYSDLTTFSFHPVKTITTCEGGAITTNDDILYERLLLLRSHGITKNPGLLGKNPGPWYHEMQGLGYNYRLCDIQAALGSSQMKRLEEFKARRRMLVARYNAAFTDMPALATPHEEGGMNSCFHLYVVRIDFEAIGMSRAEFMKELAARDIGTQVHYIPVHTQPYYTQIVGTVAEECPDARSYYEKALSLPLYPGMTDEEHGHVIRMVKELCAR